LRQFLIVREIEKKRKPKASKVKISYDPSLLPPEKLIAIKKALGETQ